MISDVDDERKPIASQSKSKPARQDQMVVEPRDLVVQVTCPRCQRTHHIPVGYSGRVRCRPCGEVFVCNSRRGRDGKDRDVAAPQARSLDDTVVDWLGGVLDRDE